MPLVSVDVKTIPTMHTENLSTLISDSGIVRCQAEAKVCDIFQNEGDPYWFFSQGIHVKRLDSLFHVEVDIVADTAYYYEKKQLWRAIANVVVKNMEGTTFETSELYWNQIAPPNALNAFYTDQPVKVTKIDGTVLPGLNGFRADQSLNTIRFLAVRKGSFNVEETDTLQNTVSSDTIQRL